MSSATSLFYDQLAAFAPSWQHLSQALTQSDADVLLPDPAHGWAGGPFLTIVVPLRGELQDRIATLQARLQAAAGTHYVYPPAALHFTILDCTAFWGGPAGGVGADWREIATVCAAVFQRHRQFRVTGLGLNLSPFTVCVQVLTDQTTLAHLRLELFAALEQSFPTVRSDPPSFGWPHLAFANIIRFMHADRRALVRQVAQLRTVALGSMIIDGAELVITDKVLSTEQTTDCTRLMLQPDVPPLQQ